MFATSHDDKHEVHEKMSEVQHELLTVEHSRKINKMGFKRERESEAVSIMNRIFIGTLESRRRIPPGKHAVYAYYTHTHTHTHAHTC